MNWRLISLGLFVIVLINTFNLGRMSVEFRSTGSDWAVLILSIIVLITSLIGLAAGVVIALDRPKN